MVVPTDQLKQMVINEASEICKKCGKLVGSKDVVPRIWKIKNENNVEEIPSKNIGSPQNEQIMDVDNPNMKKTSEEGLNRKMRKFPLIIWKKCGAVKILFWITFFISSDYWYHEWWLRATIHQWMYQTRLLTKMERYSPGRIEFVE